MYRQYRRYRYIFLYILVFSHSGIKIGLKTITCPEKRYCVKARGISEELKVTYKSLEY